MEWLDGMVNGLLGVESGNPIQTVNMPARVYYNSSKPENCGGSNCGDALANYLNEGPLKERGLSLPKGGIGPGDLAKVGTSIGSGVYKKNDLTLDNLNPGMVIHMTRQPGDKNYEYGSTHIGIVDVDDNGNKVFKSFTAGKGWRNQVINNNFIDSLPAKITAANIINPELAPSRAELRASKVAASVGTMSHPDVDPNGPDVSYLDGLLKGGLGTQEAQPTIKTAPDYIPSGAQLPPQNTAPADFATQTGAAFADEFSTKAKIFAKARFPKEDPRLAAKRYFMRDGEVLYMTDDGNVHKELGEGFSEKAKSFLANMSSRFFELTGGAIGAASPIPGGLEAGTAVGGTVRRGINQLQYGEKPDYLTGGLTDIGTAALSRIPAAAVNKGLQAIGGGGQIGRIVSREPGTFDPVEAQRLVDMGRYYGVDLTLAEIMNSPTLQRYVNSLTVDPRWPVANRKMADFFQKVRTPQVQSAIKREMDNIAPPGYAPIEAGEMAQQTSKNILQGMKDLRAAEVRPLYNTAWANKEPVDITPIFEEIDGILKNLPTSPKATVTNRVKDIKDLLTERVKSVDPETGQTITTIKPVDDLQRLHNIKRQLSLSQKQWTREGTLDDESMRFVTQIKNGITDIMEKSSDDYAAAQAEYAKLSVPIDKFKYGQTYGGPKDSRQDTIMMKLSKLGGDNLEDAPGLVFKFKPGAIENTKRWFVDNGFEEQWNILVRAHLEQKFDTVSRSIANQGGGNLGYAFRQKVVGTPQDIAKIKSAMTPDQFKNFMGLMDLMDQTTKLVYSNSLTTPMAGAAEGIRELGAGWIAKTGSRISVNPRDWFREYVDLTAPGRAAKLADAVLNPDTTGQIRAMRMLPDKVKRANELMSFLTGVYAEKTIKDPSNVRNDVPQNIWERKP